MSRIFTADALAAARRIVAAYPDRPGRRDQGPAIALLLSLALIEKDSEVSARDDALAVLRLVHRGLQSGRIKDQTLVTGTKTEAFSDVVKASLLRAGDTVAMAKP